MPARHFGSSIWLVPGAVFCIIDQANVTAVWLLLLLWILSSTPCSGSCSVGSQGRDKLAYLVSKLWRMLSQTWSLVQQVCQCALVTEWKLLYAAAGCAYLFTFSGGRVPSYSANKHNGVGIASFCNLNVMIYISQKSIKQLSLETDIGTVRKWCITKQAI